MNNTDRLIYSMYIFMAGMAVAFIYAFGNLNSAIFSGIVSIVALFVAYPRRGRR
jgi:uncharacterized MnhB-related membrane protein